MKVITENVDAYLNDITTTICDDVRSWHDWQCVILCSKPVVKPQQQREAAKSETITALLALHIDGTAYYCDDNTLILICRTPDIAALQTFTNEHDYQQPHRQFPMLGGWMQAIAAIFDHVPHQRPAAHLDIGTDFGFARDIERSYPNFAEVLAFNKENAACNPHPSVLVVEDDPLSRRLVSNAFKSDYPVVLASNAQEAMLQYMLHAPDVVFLDIDLPGGTGYTVLQELRRRDPEAFIVMFSAHSYIDSIVSAVRAGAKGFVPKPFDKERLLYYIHQKMAA